MVAEFEDNILLKSKLKRGKNKKKSHFHHGIIVEMLICETHILKVSRKGGGSIIVSAQTIKMASS